MKTSQNKLDKWDGEARDYYFEKAYKRIYESILHNQILIRRLMTKEGTDSVGKDKAVEEISKAEQFIKDQQGELKFLTEVMKLEN